MIHIAKDNVGAEPVFKPIKRNYCHYDELQPDDKAKIKNVLLNEQGLICAYCMCRIGAADSTIEHYLTRSDNPNRSLDYENLLAVCSGRAGRDRTCGNSRENKPLHIDPTEERHIRTVSYSFGGEISSNDSDFQNDIDAVLNLNISKYKARRQAALDGLIWDLEALKQNGLLDLAELQQRRDKYTAEKHKEQYVGILIWYLDEMIEEQQNKVVSYK